MATIIINRASSFVGCAVVYDVWLVNKYIGKLGNGETLEVPANVGVHKLSFSEVKCLSIGNRQNVFFDVVINDVEETVELKCGFKIGLKEAVFTVRYADNAPHIPTFIEKTQYNSAMHNESSQYDDYLTYRRNTVTCRTCGARISPRAKKCPHCGEKPLGVAIGDGISSLLKGIIMFPLIIIAILIAVVFYSGLFY